MGVKNTMMVILIKHFWSNKTYSNPEQLKQSNNTNVILDKGNTKMRNT